LMRCFKNSVSRARDWELMRYRTARGNRSGLLCLRRLTSLAISSAYSSLERLRKTNTGWLLSLSAHICLLLRMVFWLISKLAKFRISGVER